MSINSCYEDISRFNELKVKLSSIVSSLNQTNNNLSSIPNTIVSVYNIDEAESPVVTGFKNLSIDIANTSSYISDVIIPAIDIAIYNKKVDIYNMELAQNNNNR